MEILGQSTNPVVIQTHLKKLFAGIHSVQFDDGNKNILAMVSLEGEIVPLLKNIQVTPDVEVKCLIFWQSHLLWFLYYVEFTYKKFIVVRSDN